MTDSDPNWFDKNKFKNILAIINSNKFSHNNKIGEFKYIESKDLVNNIKNNTISEISAEKGLNTLKELKNTEIIKYKKRTPGQKELLNLFNDLLDTILSGKTLESESQEDKNENENENNKTIMPSNGDDDERLMSSNEDDDDETMDQNKKTRKHKRLEWYFRWNNWQIRIIWWANKIVKKIKGLKGYHHSNDYGDKELKFKYFKIELADMSNEIDKKSFKKIFGHTLETLTNKLINTTNKEKNQIIVKRLTKIKKNFMTWILFIIV